MRIILFAILSVICLFQTGCNSIDPGLKNTESLPVPEHLWDQSSDSVPNRSYGGVI